MRVRQVPVIVGLLLAGVAAYTLLPPGVPVSDNRTSHQQASVQSGVPPLLQAWQGHRSDLQIEGEGQVVKLLEDDLKGSRHQRFILGLPWGQTLLVAHNIDLAPRIPNLKVGDQVAFYGEYEWNQQGGVIHWTHHDPDNRHPHGWLRHGGNVYQ
jgi:hypothetical protein